MRPTSLLLALAFACGASAQYFSEGWAPGKPVVKGTGYSYKPVPTGAAAVPESQPNEPAVKKSPFDISTYLEYGPVKKLFSQVGVNISERLEAARAEANFWDERIPLIDDENYNELIVEEEFSTLEEERDRVWFLVITVSASQREGISRFVDEQFDKVYNLSVEADDLPNVRFGRIDYLNVTAITTKWAVWRAPFLVVLKDRGQTLRFYRPHNIRMNAEALHGFLKSEGYEASTPWKTAFAPGGNREFVLDWLAIVLTKIYNVTIMVPRWLLLLITGSIASVMVNLLHSRSSATESKVVETKAVTVEAPSEIADVPAAATSTKTTGAKQRKGNKK